MGSGLSKLLFFGREENPLQDVDQETVLEFKRSNSNFLAFTVKCSPKVSELPTLYQIDQDASRVANALYQNDAKENCCFYCEEGFCTFNNIEKQFTDHASRVKDEGLFVFFFTGHGIRDGKKFVGLVPEDFDGRLETCITSDNLISWLRRSNCRAKHVLFIIDACFSGGFSVSSPPSDSTDSESPADPYVYIMYSSEKKETSSANCIIQSSLYSYCLSHAITGIGPFSDGLRIKHISDVCCDLTHALYLLLKTIDKKAKEQHPGIKGFQVKAGQKSVKDEGTHPQLVSECLDWIKKCEGKINQLKKSGHLEKQWVVDIVLCFMLRYIAFIHLSQEDPSYVNHSAFFNIAYEAVVDTLRKYSEKEFENRERQLGLDEYRHCLRKWNVPLTNELSKLKID